LFEALAGRSPAPSAAARFTSVSGLFYLGMGLAICVAPRLIPLLFSEPAFVGREAGLLRLGGWLMAVVGWFLWIGGRTGARSLVAAGVVARLAVPLVALPLAAAGVLPHMMCVFAVIDPVSGLLTWRLMAGP
jgi:hypothetical protein